MTIYECFFKRILFLLPPEFSHHLTLQALAIAHALKLTRFFPKYIAPVKTMGLSFSNPVGLAAGLDKNGDYIDSLASLGFGFIEVGTVTPKPQAGNAKPRLFRLVEKKAIINRMGFNNKGVDHLVKRLQKTKFKGIIGVNIGKNRDTPLEKAIDDYVYCFKKVYDYASYITINISSPNTPSLRDLQHGDLLVNLLRTLKNFQLQQKKYVPIVVKISPDLNSEEIRSIATVLLQEKMDGVIATNTMATPEGGLSGQPLKARSTEVIRVLKNVIGDAIPIIASGGVFCAEDVNEKTAAGASLVQVYTSLIYRGNWFV